MSNTSDIVPGFVYQEEALMTNAFAQLNEMRRQNRLCDVTIKARNGTTHIKAHKNVLAATIPYFQKLFFNSSQSRSTISQQKIVLGVEQCALECIVDFAYSGKLRFDDKDIDELLKAANILRMKNVFGACIDHIIPRINVQNVIQRRSLAVLIYSSDLESAADRFIATNLDTISSGNEFLQLDTAVVLGILNRVGDDAETATMVEQQFEAAIRWVRHDEEPRSELIAPILHNLKWQLISPKFLVDRVLKDPLVSDSPNFQQQIKDTMTCHLSQLLAEQSLSSTKSSNQLKKDECKIVIFDYKDHYVLIYDPMSRAITKKIPHHFDDRYIEYFESKGFAYSLCEKTKQLRVWNLKNERWFERFPKIKPLTSNKPDCVYLSVVDFGLTNIFCYTPQTNEMFQIPELPNSFLMTLVVQKKIVYAIGGFDFSTLKCSTAVHRYDRVTNAWTRLPAMRKGRFVCGAAVLDGKIYACGGWTTVSEAISSAEVFDPLTQEWSMIAPMKTARADFGLVACLGKLFAIGGKNVPSSEEYDPISNTWMTLSELPKIERNDAFVL